MLVAIGKSIELDAIRAGLTLRLFYFKLYTMFRNRIRAVCGPWGAQSRPGRWWRPVSSHGRALLGHRDGLIPHRDRPHRHAVRALITICAHYR